MSAWADALKRLDGAYSPNTIRTYLSDFTEFSNWCLHQGRVALPSLPDTVVAYLDEESNRLKPSTLKHRLCAIRKVHMLCEHPDPTMNGEVELAMRRVRRAQPSRPRQALGLTADLRDRLMEVCSGDLIGLRDKMLVSVGFDTLCRRGELVSIAVGDLKRTKEGRHSVLVRRAKNDPDGAGRICHLSTRSSNLIDQWLAATGAQSGPLLRPVYGQTALALFLAPVTVSRVLKKLARTAEMDLGLAEQVSGHSLRVGAAQQLALNGRGLLQIMRVGGWRSTNIVARYIENMEIDVWQ